MELNNPVTIVAALLPIATTAWALYQTIRLRTIQSIKVHAETLRLFDVGTEEHKLLREHMLIMIRQYCEPRSKMRQQKAWGVILYLAAVIGGVCILRMIQQPWVWGFNAILIPINTAGVVDYSIQWRKLRSDTLATKDKAAGAEPPAPDTAE